MTSAVPEPTVKCPNCGSEIKLTESLAAPLVEKTRKEFDALMKKQGAEISAREDAIALKEIEIAKAKKSMDDEVIRRVNREKQKIVEEEAQKARSLLKVDLEQKDRSIADLEQVLVERNKKLAEAQKEQAALKRKERELEDAKREVELTVEMRVQESVGKIREKAIKDTEATLNFKVAEKDELIQQMQRQIEDLKRKAEQGSQQIQGEVQEVALEALLQNKFPADHIEPVAKGQAGADVPQHVIGPTGPCGTIIWESKRTRRWGEGWLARLRENQRDAKAQVAILVSQVLPKDVDAFDQVDGVWVTEFRFAVPLATAVRQALIDLALVRQAEDGRQTKMDLMYRYLTGEQFRDRVNVIFEKFVEMQNDLEREKRSMLRMWAKRESQIHQVIGSTAGMYGDLQGIAGKTLQEISGLEISALPAADRE